MVEGKLRAMGVCTLYFFQCSETNKIWNIPHPCLIVILCLLNNTFLENENIYIFPVWQHLFWFWQVVKQSKYYYIWKKANKVTKHLYRYYSFFISEAENFSLGCLIWQKVFFSLIPLWTQYDKSAKYFSLTAQTTVIEL